MIQGVKRSVKHGGDGRFTDDGTLVCRLGGFFVKSLSAAVGAGGERATVTADDLLERAFDRRGAPAEVADIVRETVLLDPGSARAAALHVVPQPDEEIVMAFMVEQTVWWALRDPLIDTTALLAHSGISGTLPSPLAVTPPSVAWAPRHLEWTVEVFPSPGGSTGWKLGEIDLAAADPKVPAATAGEREEDLGPLAAHGRPRPGRRGGRAPGDRRRRAGRDRGRRAGRFERLRPGLRARRRWSG